MSQDSTRNIRNILNEAKQEGVYSDPGRFETITGSSGNYVGSSSNIIPGAVSGGSYVGGSSNIIGGAGSSGSYIGGSSSIIGGAGSYSNGGRYETISGSNIIGGNTGYSSGGRYDSNYTSGGRQETGSIAQLSGLDIDPRLLEHENPNNCTDFAPGLPLDQYKVNVDNNPRVVRVKKPHEKLRYLQEIAVQYLKPPQSTTRAGDIVIQQGPSKQVAPAPPLVIREPAVRPPTPPPMVIRECPPQPPQPFPGKVITIPGKILPPPARKVITEKLPPMPAKPQNILIERWLPYGPQHQRVIFQQSPQTCIVPDPKNLIIEWQNAEVEVQKEFKNLGVREADPRDYLSKYGSSLIRTDQLPDVAVQYSRQASSQLASQYTIKDDLILEGDLEALKLIDLDQHGLGYLRNKLGGSLQNLGWSGSGSSSIRDDQYTSSSQSAYYPQNQSQIGYTASTSPPKYKF